MYLKMKHLLYFVVIVVALLVQSSIDFGQYDTGGNFTEIIYVGDLNSSLLIDEIQKSISNKKLNANVIIEKPENKAVGYSSDEVYYYDLMWEYQIKADSLYKKGLFGDYRKKTLGYYVPIATGIIETIQLTDSEKNEFDYNKYSIGNLKYKAVTSTTSIGYGRNQKEVNLTHDEFSFSVYKNSKYLKTINDKVLTSQKEFIELIDNVDRSTEINRDRFKNSNSENSSGSNYLNTGISNGGRSIYDINGTNALAISALKLETFDFYYDNITYRSAEVVRQLEKKNKVGGKSVEVNTIVLDSLLDKFSSNNERILIINTENQKYVEFLTKEFFNKAKEKNISIIFVIPQNLKNTSAINNYNGFTVNNTYKDKHLMTVEQSVGSYSNVYVFDRSKLSTETTKAISLIKNIKTIKNIDMYRVDRSKSWLEGGYYNVKLTNPIPSNSKMIVEENNKVIYEGFQDSFKLPLGNIYNRYTIYLIFDGVLKQRVEEEYIDNTMDVRNDIYIKYDNIKLNSTLKNRFGNAYIDRKILINDKELLFEKDVKLSNEIDLNIDKIISTVEDQPNSKLSIESTLYFDNQIKKIPAKEYNIVKSDENVFEDVKLFRYKNDLIFDYSAKKDDQILNLIIDGTAYKIDSFAGKISNVNSNSDIYIRSINVLDNSIVIYEKKIKNIQEITGNLGKNIIVDKDGKVELSLCNLNETVSNYEVYYGSVKVYGGKGEKVEFVLDKPEYDNYYKSDYIKLFAVDHKGSKYLLDQEYLKMSFWSTPSVNLENGELICDIKSLNGYDVIPYELFDNDEKVMNGITNNGLIKIDFDENIITNKKQKDYRVRYSFNSGRVKYYVDRKLCGVKFTSGGIDKVINSKSVFGISDGVKVNYICSPQDYFAFESSSQINNIKLAAFSKSDDKWINMKLTGKTVVALNGTSTNHLLYAYKTMGNDIDFVSDLKPDIIDQHLIINDLVVNNNKLTFTVNVSKNMNKQYKIFNNNELVYYGVTPNQSIDLKEGENVISGKLLLENGIEYNLESFKVYGSSNVINSINCDHSNLTISTRFNNCINKSMTANYSFLVGDKNIGNFSTNQCDVGNSFNLNQLTDGNGQYNGELRIKGKYQLDNINYEFDQTVAKISNQNVNTYNNIDISLNDTVLNVNYEKGSENEIVNLLIGSEYYPNIQNSFKIENVSNGINVDIRKISWIGSEISIKDCQRYNYTYIPPKPPQKVELIILSDYTGANKEKLNNDINTLTNKYSSKNTIINTTLIDKNEPGNSVVVENVITPIYQYTRYGTIMLKYDKHYIEDRYYGKRILDGTLYHKVTIDSKRFTENEAIGYPVDQGISAKILSCDKGRYHSGITSTQYENVCYTLNKDGKQVSEIILEEIPVGTFVCNINYYYSWYTNDNQSFDKTEIGTLRDYNMWLDSYYTKGDKVDDLITPLYGYNIDKVRQLNIDPNAVKLLVYLSEDKNSIRTITNDVKNELEAKGFKLDESVTDAFERIALLQTSDKTVFNYSYNSKGQLINISDMNGKIIAEYQYDLKGNLIKVIKK